MPCYAFKGFSAILITELPAPQHLLAHGGRALRTCYAGGRARKRDEESYHALPDQVWH